MMAARKECEKCKWLENGVCMHKDGPRFLIFLCLRFEPKNDLKKLIAAVGIAALMVLGSWINCSADPGFYFQKSYDDKNPKHVVIFQTIYTDQKILLKHARAYVAQYHIRERGVTTEIFYYVADGKKQSSSDFEKIFPRIEKYIIFKFSYISFDGQDGRERFYTYNISKH